MEDTITMPVNGKFSEDDYDIFGHEEYQNKKSNLLEMILAQQDDREINSLCDDPLVILKQQQWQELVNFLNKWFYLPDIEAFRICLSCCAAHYCIEEEPVWLFVIGVAGSGKTSIAIKGIEFLDDTHRITNLTPKSLSSGYGKNNGILGMLTEKYKGNGILTIPDMTTILSKNDNDVRDISGQLRSVYDGEYQDNKGNKGEAQVWRGKVTCIAAVTPILESYWSVGRNLGERFMYVRWRSGDLLKTANFASKQVGNRKEINDEFGRLVKQYANEPHMKSASIPDNMKEEIDKLATMVSMLRRMVRRSMDSRKSVITKIDDAEMPTRIANALCMIIKGSAMLAKREIVNIEDLRLARRVAFDSIPENRSKILAVLASDKRYEQCKDELRIKTKIPVASFNKLIEDLEGLEVIVNYAKITEVGEWIHLTDKMKLLFSSFSSFPSPLSLESLSL